MSHFKNLNKILFSFLVLGNLYLSFDYTISQESSSNDYNIELIITQNQNENDVINFDQLGQSFSFDKPVQFYKGTFNFECNIQKENLLDQLKFRIQEHTVLNYKSILLQIVINEISIQKSHFI
jgi:hypothetical protein